AASSDVWVWSRMHVSRMVIALLGCLAASSCGGKKATGSADRSTRSPSLDGGSGERRNESASGGRDGGRRTDTSRERDAAPSTRPSGPITGDRDASTPTREPVDGRPASGLAPTMTS